MVEIKLRGNNALVEEVAEQRPEEQFVNAGGQTSKATPIFVVVHSGPNFKTQPGQNVMLKLHASSYDQILLNGKTYRAVSSEDVLADVTLPEAKEVE